MGIVYDGYCKSCGYKITLCKCREITLKLDKNEKKQSRKKHFVL